MGGENEGRSEGVRKRVREGERKGGKEGRKEGVKEGESVQTHLSDLSFGDHVLRCTEIGHLHFIFGLRVVARLAEHFCRLLCARAYADVCQVCVSRTSYEQRVDKRRGPQRDSA